METVTDFILGGPKITADGDCSHEIKRHSLLGRKCMTKLDSILKSIDVTLPAKVRLVKDLVFPIVMCGCESWIAWGYILDPLSTSYVTLGASVCLHLVFWGVTVYMIIRLLRKFSELVTAAMKLKDTCSLEEKLWLT